MLNILAERKFPASEVIALASARSQGQEISFGDKRLKVQNLENFDFKGVDFALMSAGSSIAKEYGEKIGATGTIVVDNSSFWRYHADVPLVVPEVNAQVLDAYMARNDRKNIIANPNCSTAQLVPVLKVLHEIGGLKRVIVSTYQSVSGAGKEAMDELEAQTRAIMNDEEYPPQVMQKQIAFNLIPHIDKFLDNGYTKEEMKVVEETRKILDLPNLPVTCTAVRVPVAISHSEAVTVDLERVVSPAQAREALANCSIIEVWDDPSKNIYPTPIEAAGQDPVYVGRIRRDTSSENGLNLWVVADNLRIGAALNAVRIAEYLVEHKLLKQPVAS